MSTRVVHLITSECDIHVAHLDKGTVRVRVTELNPDLSNPTDFEIEGDVKHIAEALASIASVLVNIDEFSKEPS